jgi:hypothetical protein
MIWTIYPIAWKPQSPVHHPLRTPIIVDLLEKNRSFEKDFELITVIIGRSLSIIKQQRNHEVQYKYSDEIEYPLGMTNLQ